MRQKQLKDLFSKLPTKEAQYQKIIELGQGLPKMDPSHKVDSNRVRGCQSQMFLLTRSVDGKLFFECASDALISAGLAALLLYIYDGQSPETLLKCPPTVLKEIGIPALLSPSRSNGLASLYTRMQQAALEEVGRLHRNNEQRK